MKRVAIILFSLALCGINGKGQLPNPNGMDVTIHGYLLSTESGLFFQPLRDEQTIDFIASLNRNSFKIDENRNSVYSDILKGVGYKLAVKKYFEDTIKKNPTLNITDTITYFKCNINIGMDFFDTSYTSFSEIGYGFVLNNKLIYYGNLAIRNQLYKIIPDDDKVTEQFYKSYLKKKMFPPEWLKNLYIQRKIKKK